jgi:energy-coupling factor transporter transmembrane protein EcfT
MDLHTIRHIMINSMKHFGVTILGYIVSISGIILYDTFIGFHSWFGAYGLIESSIIVLAVNGGFMYLLTRHYMKSVNSIEDYRIRLTHHAAHMSLVYILCILLIIWHISSEDFGGLSSGYAFILMLSSMCAIASNFVTYMIYNKS